MKLLFFLFLLPLTFHAQSIDSLQREVEQLKLENQTLRGIMIDYVHFIDSINSKTKDQQSEIDLLSTELLKSISNESLTMITDRKRLNEISIKNIFLSEEVIVRMKVYVNSEGKVVLVKVLNSKGMGDSQVVDLVVTQVKKVIRYEPLEDAGIQTAFYTVKILP